MSDVVNEIESHSKKYQLSTIGYGTLQRDNQAWWAVVRGEEDHNRRIGERWKRVQ
jgi:hypothetical protein